MGRKGRKGRRGQTDPKDQPVNVDQLLADIRKAKGLPEKPTAPKTPREYTAEERKRREEQRQAVIDGRMDTVKVVQVDHRGNVYETYTTIPHGRTKTPPPPKPVMTLEEIQAEDRAARSARPPKRWRCYCNYAWWHGWNEKKCVWCNCQRRQAKEVTG